MNEQAESIYKRSSSGDDGIEQVRHALDELFYAARMYRNSQAYQALLEFVTRFRFYSPFNAMLIHIQMPGADFVAPADRWMYEWHRTVKPGQRPLVILQPMGPVMFVFDVSQTEPMEGAHPLPPEVENPFKVNGELGDQLELTWENAKRDGVAVFEQETGSQAAGSIRAVESERRLAVLARTRPRQEYKYVPMRYEILLNSKLTREEKYATLVHELAHLYCGHLGTPELLWWPDRQDLGQSAKEFEAESVSYLVCKRLGIKTTSEQYLSGYFDRNEQIPLISLDRVMAAAGLIEDMGRRRLKPRKPGPGAPRSRVPVTRSMS